MSTHGLHMTDGFTILTKLRSKLKQFKLTGEPFMLYYSVSVARVGRYGVYGFSPWWIFVEHNGTAESIILAIQVIKLEDIGRRLASW